MPKTNQDANDASVPNTAAAIGKRARKTKFSQESAAMPVDPAAEAARQGMAMALYQGPEEQSKMDVSKFIDKSLPLILKPKDWPVGVAICARLERVLPSPIAEFKNNLLEFVTSKKQRFCFPDVATVHKALDDDPSKFIGHEVFIKYLGSKQGRDTSRKPARVFEVKVSPEVVVYDFDAPADESSARRAGQK
jgi:hypothetical protein